MKQTWRWFGPTDSTSVSAMIQAGVEGVVTSLYHIPSGAVWPVDEIKTRQNQIASLEDGSPSGLSWDVVESIPVSEEIKTQTGDWRVHIEAYKESLKHLSECGIRTVCYNFMPVLDWTRTTLRKKQPSGAYAMHFDVVDFAVFDIHLLERENAAHDFPQEIIEKAKRRFDEMTAEERSALTSNIVSGLPGANDNWTLKDVRKLLSAYETVGAEQLRKNLITFLEMITPVAADVGINLCCHPDDPPFSILGLPRIMSTIEDYEKIMRAVDVPQNGITLCTGSMGVLPKVDFVRFIKNWGHRIHFAHLRNTQRTGEASDTMYSFFEAEHLRGDTDMVSVIDELLAEEKRRRAAGQENWEIPMRPDHGQDILHDIGSNQLPGYPLLGRLKGLAELRGVMTALNSSHLSNR